MQGNIVGEPIEDFVDSQIRTRQSAQFSGYGTSLRNDDQLKYLTNRNAWIKLASSVSVQVDTILGTQLEDFISSKLKNIGLPPTGFFGTQLAEKAVLFNTISQYTGGVLNNNRAGVTNANNLWSDSFIYGIGGTEFGIQPPPGIIGATIDSLNRGSIRKANITLKAHNKFQFDVIELLYLRLGFTMMLEWGWDKYLDNKGKIQQVGNTIIEDEWFKTNGTTQLQMLSVIQKKRRDYQGNYDGFFGKVSNFTWSFNPDGSYDISIDLITLGDVIESLKVNTSVKAKFYPDGGVLEDIKFSEDNKLFNTNIAKVATLNTLGYFLFSKMREITNNFTYQRSESANTNYPNYITFFTKNDNSYKSPQFYVRLGELLSQLESLVVPILQNSNSPKFSQITFEKEGCLLTYFPNQVPLDPRVCIFKPSLNSYGDITGVVSPTYLNSIPVPYLVSVDGNTYGSLMDIYVNFEFIAGLLVANGDPDQQLSLFKFLQDLCNGINTALGGVNKLEPVIKEDYKITIIDQTLSFPEVKDTVSLEVYGYNPSNTNNQVSNFVKDVKFVSKITPQLASMVSIGATAAGSNTSEIDGTAFSKWSEGLVDRFAETISEPNGLNLVIEQEQADKTREKYAEAFRDFTLADQSFQSLANEAEESTLSAIASLDAFAFKVFGAFALLKSEYATQQAERSEELASTLDDDLNEKRIVRDPFNPEIDGLAMGFEEYLARIIQLEKDKLRKNIYNQNEISQLTSTNYAIYLLKAFGGVSGEIKVQSLESTPNQILTGPGSEMSFTNRTATVENLQVDINQSRYQEFDEVFISQGKSAYKTYINTLNNNRYKTDNIPSSEVGFIPLSFELVLEGISGIKIYNKLKINNEFLPSNYPSSLSFIITKVNHNISDNDWNTSLSTISIPRTEPYKHIPLPPSNSANNSGTGVIGPQPDNGTQFLILDGRNNRSIMTLDALLSELDPVARPSFKKFFDILKEKYSGYKAIVNDVRRTWEESYNLKKINSKNAAPGFSQHNYGLAIDINIETPASTTRRTLLKSNKTPWIEEGIDKVATDAGLRWGGNFSGYIDCVHFDYNYNINTAYSQITTQAKSIDPTIIPPFTGFTNEVLAKIRKIDNLIKQGKVKLR
jgi:hypothetical protein